MQSIPSLAFLFNLSLLCLFCLTPGLLNQNAPTSRLGELFWYRDGPSRLDAPLPPCGRNSRVDPYALTTPDPEPVAKDTLRCSSTGGGVRRPPTLTFVCVVGDTGSATT